MFGSRGSTRRAVRAGAWYEGDSEQLARYIEDNFQHAERRIGEEKGTTQPAASGTDRVLGIIGPHAGLSYCGATSATAYSRLRDFLYRPTAKGGVEGDQVETIFLIGPSHAKYFRGIQFSKATAYATPLGDLPVSTAVQKALEGECAKSGCETGWLTAKDDEQEHSLELHTPFLAHILNRPPAGRKPLSHISICPIVVGDMDPTLESAFGTALRSFIPSSSSAPSKHLFAISSDFCHWGERFRFTYRWDRDGAIGDGIERMDREGMRLITANDTKGWRSYMDRTENTICGRHAIASFLYANEGAQKPVAVDFLHYSQSGRVVKDRDSSVSYAAAVLTQK